MVASDYSMARNEDRDGIGSDGLCNRSHGIRLTDAYSNVLVASGLSVRRALKKSPFFMTKTENAYDL